MHSTSSSRRTAALRINDPEPPHKRRSRLIGAILIVGTLALAVSLVTSGTVSIGSGILGASPTVSKADVTVDFGTSTTTDDPAAIGVDESTYGMPSDVNDPAAQELLKRLGVGYSRIWLSLANPADSTSSVLCAAAGCDTSVSPTRWVQMMQAAGEVPVAGIPDTLSAADAAAIVRHFSGSAGTGQPIRYWLIGNEPNAGNAESATTYDARFNTLYAAMKSADPSIEIGGPATLGFDQPFLQQFLKDCGSRADFVDFHFYPAHEDAAQLLAELPAMSQDLATLRTMIKTTVPSRASSIAIHVGEWNFSADPGTLAQYAFTGFASVLDADLLGRILTAGADSLAWGSKNGPMSLLYGDTTGDPIAAPSGYRSDTPMPLYEAIGMFSGQGLFPRFGTTIVSAASTRPGVDAFASSGPDEIVIVNTNTSARSVTLRVSSGNPQSAVVWQLHQTGAVPRPPVRRGTATSVAGLFKLSLPADSVTTLVMTTLASDQK